MASGTAGTGVDFFFAADMSKALTQLVRVRDQVADAKPAWDAFADAWSAQMGNEFASGGLTTGNRWQALSPAYAARKRLKYPHTTVLTATGRLRQQFARPMGVEKITKDSMELGADEKTVPYGAFHQDGAGHNPRRAFLVFNRGQKRTLIRLVQQHLTGKWVG